MARYAYCVLMFVACMACRRDAPVTWPASARDVWEGGLRRDWNAVGLSTWLSKIPLGLEVDAMFALASDPDMKAADWKIVSDWSKSIDPGHESFRFIWWVQMCYEFNESEWSRDELFRVVNDGAPWNVLKAVRMLCRDTSDSGIWVSDAERWANGLISGSVKQVGGSLRVNEPQLRRLGAALRLVLASSGIDVSRIADKW